MTAIKRVTIGVNIEFMDERIFRMNGQKHQRKNGIAPLLFMQTFSFLDWCLCKRRVYIHSTISHKPGDALKMGV